MVPITAKTKPTTRLMEVDFVECCLRVDSFNYDKGDDELGRQAQYQAKVFG